MNPVKLVRFLLRTSAPVEDMLILRLDGIQGYRLDMTAPALTAFTPRRRRIVAR
jgi:hypothetical protein